MTQSALMEFEQQDRVAIGTITGATVLDSGTVADFGNQSLEYVKHHPGVHLLLDFGIITYLSSAALTELLRVREAAKTGGGSLRVCNVKPEIYKVFRITNMDTLFHMTENEDLETARGRLERALAVAADEAAWAGQNAEG